MLTSNHRGRQAPPRRSTAVALQARFLYCMKSFASEPRFRMRSTLDRLYHCRVVENESEWTTLLTQAPWLMPRETIEIDFSALESYEAGALFFSVLAYPEADITRREAFRVALCRWYIVQRAEIDDDWKENSQAIKPLYFANDDKSSKTFLLNGFQCLHRRFNSAMYRSLPNLAGIHKVQDFPTTPYEMTRLGMLHLGMKGKTNATYLTKTWKPSKPVTHAAAAFLALSTYLLEEADNDDLQWMHFLFLFMKSKGLLFELLTHVELYRGDISKIAGLPIREEETIQFVPSRVPGFQD
jgi:hypothetical protein